MPKHLVVGPPGTGKTTYVASQAQRAAERYGRDGVSIVSLTKTAAAEIGRRSTLDPERVGTLHSMCFRALECGRNEVADSPQGIKAWNEAHPGQRLSVNGGSEDDVLGGSSDSVLTEMGRWRHRMVAPAEWPSACRDFYEQWEDWKHQTGRLDFTDMIERAISEVPVCPGAPAVLFLDEAQDSSTLEHTLLERWMEHVEQLVVVGDSDQSIFGFRGGDPRAMEAGELASRIVLEQSYRVPRAVHEVATAWIEQIPDRPPAVYRPREEEGHLEHWGLSAYDTAGLIRGIEGYTDGGLTVMALATCHYLIGPLMSACRKMGVPFFNPYRPNDGRLNPMRGPVERLATFCRPRREVWGDQRRDWDWKELAYWIEPLSAKALPRGTKEFVKRKAAANRFGVPEPPPDAETMMNLLPEGALNTSVRWFEEALTAGAKTTKEAQEKAGKYAYAMALYRRDPRLLVATPRLILGTVHSAKGGEADVVLLAPDVSQRAWMGQVPDWQGARVRGSDQWAEMVRTMYVGMTRAKHTLALLSPTGESPNVEWL